MAVLCEAFSVIVRRDRIVAQFRGGWEAFLKNVPNQTACADESLVRVGFMHSDDIDAFVAQLCRAGLTFMEGGQAIDFAIVDQTAGLRTPATWLEFARLPHGTAGGLVSACWRYEGTREMGRGIHFPIGGVSIATPSWWTFEGSVSDSGSFFPHEHSPALTFLRAEGNVNVFRDETTGEEVSLGRTT
jgi:hypothetical protein